ncbi:DNA-directed RNA polymerase II subunit RPB1-like [Homarus americanus]|uniref:DNA-directed RNA polymerase II subunit RPB1-like n=1 Tax=Homarus americanus TaxID=6706 RepID=UPI001C46D8B4|nr:DNA-directed RNA polymerase II subunit RPB1-like [Homarus americanus]
MAPWTSLALLSALAVSTLSSPRPDESAYKIPHVGTGRRSQYYVQHADGTFKYGYDTGEGAFEGARSSRVGQVDGNFGYRDPEGNNIHLQYVADEGGFQPKGAHLPVPHPDFARAHAEARARPSFTDPLADPNADASYGFQFAGEGQTRSEQSDSDGNVRGSYTYTDEEGRTRTYTYTAGRGTGFVVEGDDLPQAPEDPASTPAATRLSSFPAAFPSSSLRPTSPASSAAFRASTASGAPSRPFSTPSGTPAGPVSFQRSTGSSDPSYSFSFDAGDHSRSESADANLNVDGKFSFVADDGVRRSVTYEAGSDTGFLARGDHLPRAPQSHSGSQTTSSAFSSSQTPYRSPSASLPSSVSSTPTFSRSPSAPRLPGFTSSQTQYSSPSSRPSARPYTGQFEPANTRSQQSPDGSYSFAYETSSHSRAESGDRDNNVVGNFDFVADDGQRRAIEYEAGSRTGFIAKGDHIPVGPAVPGAPSGQPTGRIVPVQEVPFVDPLAGSNADASYNFAFDSEQYSRSESADADGNVRGTYTVVDDDGTRRTHRFRAGEGIGFETEEVSTSRGPPPSRSPSSATFRSPAAPGTAVSSSTSFTAQPQGSFPSPSTRTASTRSSSSSFSPSATGTRPDASNFQLRQYDASENRGKYGYVLTFDN